MSAPVALAVACALGLFLAALVAWSPWDNGSQSPGQGGSDTPQVLPTTPPQPVR
jgi:hypothetical protein